MLRAIPLAVGLLLSSACFAQTPADATRARIGAVRQQQAARGANPAATRPAAGPDTLGETLREAARFADVIGAKPEPPKLTTAEAKDWKAEQAARVAEIQAALVGRRVEGLLTVTGVTVDGDRATVTGTVALPTPDRVEAATAAAVANYEIANKSANKRMQPGVARKVAVIRDRLNRWQSWAAEVTLVGPAATYRGLTAGRAATVVARVVSVEITPWGPVGPAGISPDQPMTKRGSMRVTLEPLPPGDSGTATTPAATAPAPRTDSQTPPPR